MSAADRADQRRVSLVVALVFGVALVVLGALLVPWQWLPDGQSLTRVTPEQVLTPGQLARVTAYSSQQRLLGLTAYAVSLGVSLLLGLTGLGGRLLGRLRGWWWVRVVLGVVLVLLVGVLVTLPFGLRIHAHAAAAGLSTQGVGGWLHDQALSLLVSAVGTSLALVVLIGLARRWPRTWPAWGALLATVLVALGSFVYPVLVEPLFNRFTPLPDGALRGSIMRLAAAEHVRLRDVLVADASRRTTSLNAYVTGFGSTRRVVLYDTTVRDLPRKQIESVVAHELGHAEHQDVPVGTLLGALAAGMAVGLLGLVLSRSETVRRAGTTGPGDPRSVALLLALAAAAGVLAAPVQNAASRAVEARADRTALTATRDPASFVAVQKRLDLSALGDPQPPAVLQLWFGTHPSTVQRIGMAETLRPGLETTPGR